MVQRCRMVQRFRERSSWFGHRLSGALLVAAAAVALALTVAACGGGGAESSATDAASTASTTQKAPSGTPLKIGVLADSSGPNSNGQGNGPQALSAWAEAVNAEGGVAGHPVEMVIDDTKGDAATATSQVKQLTGDPSVVAMVLFDVSTEGVVAEEIDKAGMPVIGGMGYDPEAWGKLPNWLPLTTSFPAVIEMGMVMGAENGGTTAAFAICGENPSCAAAEPLAKGAAEGVGMSFAGNIKVLASTPDFTAECLQIKEHNVDYVALALQTITSMRLISECQTQGYTGQWGIWDGSVLPQVIEENDSGVPVSIGLSAFPWFAEEGPAQAYREMMEGQGVSESVWADPHATAAYATMQLFRKTLDKNAGSLPASPSRSDIIKTYGTIKNESLEGLLPQPVTFTPNKPEPPIECYWLGKFENGTFSGATLAEPSCEPKALKAES